MIAPGGTNLNERYQRRLLGGYPDFDIDGPGAGGSVSGPRSSLTRSVTNLRQGRAQGAVTYAWTLPTKPGGSTTTVSGGSTATATIVPDAAGTYVLQCVVTFSDGTAITKSTTYVSA